jgi:hypothetical protein
MESFRGYYEQQSSAGPWIESVAFLTFRQPFDPCVLACFFIVFTLQQGLV